MIDGQVGVTFSHDQALVLSEWLDQLIGTERLDVLVNEDPAVWAALHRLAGALEKSLPDIFAADYGHRLDRARWRLGTPATPAARHRRRATAPSQRRHNISHHVVHAMPRGARLS